VLIPYISQEISAVEKFFVVVILQLAITECYADFLGDFPPKDVCIDLYYTVSLLRYVDTFRSGTYHTYVLNNIPVWQKYRYLSVPHSLKFRVFGTCSTGTGTLPRYLTVGSGILIYFFPQARETM